MNVSLHSVLHSKSESVLINDFCRNFVVIHEIHKNYGSTSCLFSYKILSRTRDRYNESALQAVALNWEGLYLEEYQ